MTWSMKSMKRHPQSPVAAALQAAVRDGTKHGAAVGIWVVWLRSGRVVHCEWSARLDIDAPVAVRADVESVIVIAIAPQRLAHPVSGRAVVIGEFLEAKGFRVEVVHVRTLRTGALWTTLRGRAVGGIVPAPRISPHRPRLPYPRAAALSARLLVAVCAVATALICAVPVVAAPPHEQPGLSIEPHSGGQAGVTAPPRTAAPAETTTDQDQTNTVVASADQVSSAPAAQAITASPPQSAPRESWRPSSAAPRQMGPTVTGEQVAATTDLAYASDVVRVGAFELPRPEWMPAPVAAREREWNAFLAEEAATVVEQAGWVDPGVSAVLGAGNGEPVPPPQELVFVQMVAADPQALIPVVAEVAAPFVSEVSAPVQDIVAQAADVLGSVLVQLPPA